MNIERLFHDEVREKKRTASGVHHKTGKRGYVGKLYFTSDLLKGKAKREYQKAGKVEISNMYDTVMPYEEFEVLPEDAKKQYLIKYRERHTNKKIMEVWNMGHNKFYYLLDKLNIKKDGRSRNGQNTEKRVGTVAKANTKSGSLQVIKNKIEEKQEPIVEIIDKKEKENGMTLSLNDNYSAEEIVRKLEKFGLILSDEEVQFKVEIKISEIA